MQVKTRDADLLTEAMPQVVRIDLPQATHMLKADVPGHPLATYTDPNLPLHPDLIPAIVRFLDSHRQAARWRSDPALPSFRRPVAVAPSSSGPRVLWEIHQPPMTAAMDIVNHAREPVRRRRNPAAVACRHEQYHYFQTARPASRTLSDAAWRDRTERGEQ